MLALFRLLFIMMIVLTIIYVSLSFYGRAQQRERLEEEWRDQGRPGDRDAFVRAGLEVYQGSLRRKLLLGVYIVPLTAIAVLVYVTNYM